jgi:multicomponent Na+:H+ antiporter subunit E
MSPIPAKRARRSIFLRSVAYFVLWMIMVGGDVADVVPGLGAAILAAWVSVLLMPPDPGSARVRPLGVLRLSLRFVWWSVVAGVDVARRAFSPSLPLKPGYVAYPVALPPSAARNLFMSVTSLMPGTLPAGTDESGALIYHCLDVDQPVIRELEEEEALLVDALGGTLGSAEVVVRDPRTPDASA